MPAQPWNTDLERLRRELTTRLDRLETVAQSASRASSGNDQARQMTALERRLDAVERRVQTTVDETNRTFTSAHTSDQRMTSRLDALERRVQTTIEQTNRTFESAHTEDGRMTTRLDTLDRRLAAVERARA